MTTAIFWFTLDLRLQDNPGLAAAARLHDQVIPVFILDYEDPWFFGGASLWWLHHTLDELQKAIAKKGGKLVLRQGPTLAVLEELVQQTGAQAVYFSRAYEPWLAHQQEDIFRKFSEEGVEIRRYGGRLLLEPDQIYNRQGKPFQVFTPFFRHCRNILVLPGEPQALRVRWFAENVASAHLEDWQLLPTKPNWAKGFAEWRPGERGAHAALKQALKAAVTNYADRRDRPAEDGTTRLSPHLHFGEISPRHIWQSVSQIPELSTGAAEPFLRQLIWREFNFYLLHHWPQITQKPFRPAFELFPWVQDEQALGAWQTGNTGYPIVDAGMRQLWRTGWMHNRVRMIVASFLTKHLRIHWAKGAQWFWDTLVDADLANNSAGWQWVAGSGADAAPYFRIFNPVTQGEKFDSDGEYIRTWVPELAKLPAVYIHKPWQAPQPILRAAGVELGKNYPPPIVNHEQARQAALEAYSWVKRGGGS